MILSKYLFHFYKKSETRGEIFFFSCSSTYLSSFLFFSLLHFSTPLLLHTTFTVLILHLLLPLRSDWLAATDKEVHGKEIHIMMMKKECAFFPKYYHTSLTLQSSHFTIHTFIHTHFYTKNKWKSQSILFCSSNVTYLYSLAWSYVYHHHDHGMWWVFLLYS